MKKKIVYLGGYYQCEVSMRVSFTEANVEMIFLIDDNPFGIAYHYGRMTKPYRVVPPWLSFLPESELKAFLTSYGPDLVVHRYYKNDPMMHPNSYEICRGLSIPHVLLKMETTGNETPNDWMDFDKTDLILYVHDYDEVNLQYAKASINRHFYPYGVSSMERRLKIDRVRMIGNFGYYRNIKERVDSLNFFLDGIRPTGHKLHTYGFINEPNVDHWEMFSEDKNWDLIETHGIYDNNDSTNIINLHSIAVNVETLWHMEGMYSHKMWQTLGCGVPTITKSKESIYELFPGLTVIKVKTTDDVTQWINTLSNSKDLELRETISRIQYNFVHENYDWYRRFSKIMKEEGVW